MLVIRKEQIEKFIAEDNTQLIRVIREIVQEAFHEEVASHSDETLDGMVRIGIERARSRGFELAADISSFVALMFEISPRFDSVEAVDAILKDEKLSPGLKIEQIIGRVTEEAWLEAAQTYDEKIWFPEASGE